ncbi:MAG: chorismate mutase [Xenococcaceae cyanobacterium MO_188.B32]|nr:chorismate mutase [Xenococcaceae cyanobacterium MO_188.B32]
MDKLRISTQGNQLYHKSTTEVQWRVRGLRGATTASENSVAAIAEAVEDLLDILETENQLNPAEIVSVTFSITRDLDALFPASIARCRPGWNRVPLLDLQHMQVSDSLERCIRVLIHLNTPMSQQNLRHIYLRGAAHLRLDLAVLS